MCKHDMKNLQQGVVGRARERFTVSKNLECVSIAESCPGEIKIIPGPKFIAEITVSLNNPNSPL